MLLKQRIEELFHEARSLPPDIDQAAWVAEHCGRDSELFAEVAGLLEAHAALNRRNSTSPHVEPADESAALPDGMFGPYRPVSLLGRGGMSAVYRAVREGAPFQQSVALKIMAPFLAGPEFVRRFETECRLLAQLEHPNITRLLDGGLSSSGQPYLAMELVEGERFDAYADGRRLNVAARLKLFLQVCEAVDYAHRNLIVHRDLKPANILINRDGAVKLLDFGTAALLAPEASETVTRARMLTPRYASPEQLRGERVGVATDIYSLGVILYELLTGAWPFGNPNSLVSELNRAAGQSEAKPPNSVLDEPSAAARNADARQLGRLLKGDISAVALKALESDPARRYASVRDLASDIQRYLEDRAVAARGHALTYRATRFVRRNRLRLAGLTIVAALLTAAGVYSFVQYGREQRRLAELRTLNESYLTDVYREVAKLPGSTKACLLIVDRAKNSLDTLFAESPRDRETRRALATAYLRLAEVQGEPFLLNLGNSQAATQDFQRAKELVAAIRPVTHETAALELRAQLGLAGLEVRAGSYAGATAILRDAQATAKELAASVPEMQINGKPVAALYVRTYILLGHALLRAADITRDVPGVQNALRTFEDGLAISKQMQAREPALAASAGVANQYIGYSYELLGDFTHQSEFYKHAAVAHGQSMESARGEFLRSPSPQRQRDYADTLTDYGWAQHLCRRAEAVATLREAVSLMKGVADADPQSEETQLDLANAYSRLGAAEVETNQLASGLGHLEQARALIHLPAKIQASDRELVVLFARVQESRADGLERTGRVREAASALREAVSAVEAGRSVPAWRQAELEAKAHAQFHALPYTGSVQAH